MVTGKQPDLHEVHSADAHTTASETAADDTKVRVGAGMDNIIASEDNKVNNNSVEESVPPHFSPVSPPASVVRLEHLFKTIDDRPILRDLCFDIKAGSYVALLGANGAGKSTLLKILSTLIPLSRGKYFLFGKDLSHSSTPALRARIGMIGHQSMLYRDLSAMENLVFFGKLYGIRKARERALELLEYVGLEDRADDPVRAFSRGMLQRVAIARSLMHSPDLLLADEPFAGLDAPSSRMLELMMERLNRERGMTIILANHDIGQSLKLTNQALVLKGTRLIVDAPSAELDAEGVLQEVSNKK